MKRYLGLGLLVSGCVAAGGVGGEHGGGGGGGGGSHETGGEDSADTGEPAEEPVVLRVCSDGDYTTVQSAVDAAPDGAIVELCGERFTEHVVVTGRAITLRGGEEGATLDGDGEDRALVVTGSVEAPAAVTVEGITVTDGWGAEGGGIWCENATLALTDVDVTGNRAEKGGGIASLGCAITMTRVAITANSAWSEGGGGRIEGGSLNVVQSRVAANSGANGGGLLVTGAEGEVLDSVFEDNAGHVGGGIWFDGGFAFTHNIVRRNSALYTGGGFGAVDGHGAITRNSVYENQSVKDGGGGFTQSHTGLVADNDFHDNVSQDDAGALRMLYGAAVVERNTFTSNEARNGAGGALKVSHAGCEVRDNTFLDNVAEDGGGIEVDDDVSSLVSNTFIGNEALGRGGAIHLNEPYWDMSIDSLLIEDNVAGSCGGAIAMDDDGLAEMPEDRYTVYASHIVARGNTAAQGGAICILEGGIVLTNSLVVGNVASGDGGALEVVGADATVTNVTMVGNASTRGTISLSASGSAVVTDSIVTGNTGGVLYAQGTFPVWQYNLHFGNEGVAFTGMADPTGENGNVDEDPAFVNAAGGDYHLGAGSPAIDAGEPTRTDADGSRVDMGAYGGTSGAW